MPRTFAADRELRLDIPPYLVPDVLMILVIVVGVPLLLLTLKGCV